MENKYLVKIADQVAQHPDFKTISPKPGIISKYLHSQLGSFVGGAAGSAGGAAIGGLAGLAAHHPEEGAAAGAGLGGLGGSTYGLIHGWRHPVKDWKKRKKDYDSSFNHEEESKNQEKAAQVLEKLAKAPSIKKSHKGLLHKKLGIPEDKDIPLSKLRSVKAKAKKNGDTKLEREATFAINAKTKWGK